MGKKLFMELTECQNLLQIQNRRYGQLLAASEALSYLNSLDDIDAGEVPLSSPNSVHFKYYCVDLLLMGGEPQLFVTEQALVNFTDQVKRVNKNRKRASNENL